MTTPTDPAAADRRFRPGLILIGIVMVAIPAVAGYRYFAKPTPAPDPVPATPPSLASTDLSSLTPRQAADRLYDRVMRAVVGGDMTEARNFLPMAINSYVMVDSLGGDGAFHLSMLLRVAENYEDALTTAREALGREPDHLLVLSEAALAALALGDTLSAREYAGRFLSVYDREAARTVEDYEHHRNILPDLHTRMGTITGASTPEG